MKQYSNETIEQCNNRVHRGFTLIELLIVIAILGVMSAGVFAALNVTSSLNKANLAKAKTFSASVENDLSIAQVGKWSFEEGSGTTAKDTSGYGNNGTVNGATWKNTSDCALGFGGCLSFDGSSSYIEIPDSNSLNIGGKVTLSIWVYAQSFANDLADIYARHNGVYSGIVLEKNTGVNSISFYVGDGVDTEGASTTELSTNRWYHIAGTHDGIDNIKVYLNGVLQGTKIQPPPAQYAGGVTRIGFHSTVFESRRYWYGLIDEVAIYTESLTGYQIQQLYAQGLLRHQLARQGW